MRHGTGLRLKLREGANGLIVVALAVSGLIPPALPAAATDVDEGTRTVTTDTMTIVWSETNPEEIVDIRWKGSPNLTNPWVHPNCPSGGDLEYFGNAWATPSTGADAFTSFVGWATTGTWDAEGDTVSIESLSSGCFGSWGKPIFTDYEFGDHPDADQFRVTRTFDFGDDPFTGGLLAYSPRLFPRDHYTSVLHPDATGTSLRTEAQADCEGGCLVDDWNGSWFAVHDPSTGSGIIVQHHASSHDVALWVEQDGGSFTSRSSVLLVEPPGGFTGVVTETQTLCFYDSARWPTAMQQSLNIPGPCQISGAFFDDNGNTFETDIEWLAESGITKGCNPPANTEFCPDDSVTRGQMAAFLHRGLNDFLSPTQQVDFVDDDGNTFEADIEWLAATGVTKGCNPPDNDRYCPDDFVTRGQMAAFLHRALNDVLTPTDQVDFVDDDGNTFEADIEWLAATGVTKGCNPPANDKFCPDDFVTRGQMAAFLHRALGS